MEDKNTMEVMEQDTDAELDAAWGDDEETTTVPVAEPETPSAETPANEPQQETPSTPSEQAPADQPRMFTLKNRDETRQVSEQDLIAMAQKGWDYDTVRQERDQLRQYRGEADPALALIDEYAARMGMTRSQYIDHCRREELKAKGMTEQQATFEVQQQNREADLVARERALAAKEQAQTSANAQAQQAAQARQKNISDFIKAYPNVDPKSIPKDVWDAVLNKGDTLTNAYTMYENRRLQAELAAEKQNKTNQASAPGSLGGNSMTDQDEIDRIWADDDD